MLAYLLSGELASAGELARAASVSAAPALTGWPTPRWRTRWKRYTLTDAGGSWLAQLGLSPTAPSPRRRFA